MQNESLTAGRPKSSLFEWIPAMGYLSLPSALGNLYALNGMGGCDVASGATELWILGGLWAVLCAWILNHPVSETGHPFHRLAMTIAMGTWIAIIASPLIAISFLPHR